MDNEGNGQWLSLPVDADGEYVFRGLSTEHTCAVNWLMVKTVAFPGEFGVMGGVAASNDPLFVMLHIFEKRTTALHLAPRYRGLTIGMGNLTGLGWNSKTLALFEPGLGGELDDGTYLTNKQFGALLKPDRDTAPLHLRPVPRVGLV